MDKIAPSMEPIGDISLKRMLARIDIVNSTSNFTVDVAYLVNYNNAGYVAPVWDAMERLISRRPVRISRAIMKRR